MLNSKEIQELAEIYNHLLQVKTDVPNSFIMVDGMRALQNFILKQSENSQEE